MKKKILIIPSWYPTPFNRISGSFFQEQANVLIDKFEVKVLYLEFVNHPPINFRPNFLASLRFLPRSIASIGKHLLKCILQKKNKVQLPDDNIFLNPPLLYYIELIFTWTTPSYYKVRICKYLKRYNQLKNSGWVPDLIHAQSIDIAGIVAQNIKAEYGIPYVLTEHNHFNLYYFQKRIQQKVRKSFMEANLVLSISYDKVRQLNMFGFDLEPNMVYNYVNEKMFDLQVEKYQPGSPLKIVSIGAASFIKDYITLLKALSIIKNKRIPFTFTLIGLKIWSEDKTYKKIIDFIESNGLKNEIHVIDRIERLDAPKYLNLNNIFVLTSIAEGLSLSILEAMASGLTVIATRHGGAEDVLSDKTGILVKIKDYQDIADKLIDIYNGNLQFDPNLIRNHIISICGSEVFSARLSSYYEQAIYNAGQNRLIFENIK
jgi:glycosyltransferase involved in cell wall biosynthesis